MTTFAKIADGQIVKWPYRLADLRADHPNVSFPAEPTDELFIAYGATAITPSEKPSADGKIAVEATPELIDDAPVQRWELRDNPLMRGIPPGRLHKITLIERLAEAGLLAEAYVALGGPGSLGYERWQASVSVDPENPDVLALLTAIGADPAVMLAPE